MIDIGVNLTNSRFDKDRNEVIDRAKQAGLSALLVTGTNISESEKAAKLCQTDPQFLYSTAGVHPHDADHVSTNYLSEIESLAKLDCVKAIGECGLDFNRNFSAPEQQKKVFEAQIALASRLNMPLFLHQRDAFDTWLAMLTPHIDKVPAMVSHCFTANLSQLKQCLDAGMYIGITGWICDNKRGQELQDIVRYLPLDRLMVETDAPYLTPKTLRPKPKSSRNEPSYLPHIVDVIAQHAGHSVAEITQHSVANSRRVFGLDSGHE
ncbi:TatD family hydrolase [Thalassotalea fusca]